MKMNRRFVILACFLCALLACAQSVFTPLEQQSISVDTPGLFEHSDAFSVDFSQLKSDEYSFPLPVGKAVLVDNNSRLEISTTKGDAVKAMFDGVVRLSRNNPPYGHVVVIRHYNGLETVYGYNAQNLVKVGDKVKAGQTIAIVGENNNKVGCLFAIMVNGRRINPATIVQVNSHQLYRQKVTFKKAGYGIEVKTAKHRVSGMTDNPFADGNVYRWDLTKMNESEWAYPLPGAKIISPYGNRRGGHVHSGVDLKTKPNDKIVAAFDGVVTRSCPYSGYGNCIVIKHPNGLETLYSHQSRNLVKVGQKVKAGEVIGLTGRTGRATTEHLHFEVSYAGRKFNPGLLFDHQTKKLQSSVLNITKSGSVTSKKK